jgi:hypothetical protein
MSAFYNDICKGIVERFINRRALHMYRKRIYESSKATIGPGSFRQKRGGTTEK